MLMTKTEREIQERWLDSAMETSLRTIKPIPRTRDLGDPPRVDERLRRERIGNEAPPEVGMESRYGGDRSKSPERYSP